MNKKATIYARCSTDHQDQSIQDQLKAIRPYAAANGYELVGEPFIDEGYSGTDSAGRPAFMRMMNLIEAGRANFEFILCYDTSRWSRSINPNEARGWEFICNRHGIKVLYTNDSFGNENTLPNDMVKGVRQSMNSEFSKQLGKVVIRGMKSRAEKGYRLSHAAYGYARAEATPQGEILHELPTGRRVGTIGNHAVLVLGNPRQIEVIRAIFRMYLHGLGLKTIARKLNADKIPPARGKRWCDQVVRRILMNEVYIGTQVYGKSKRGAISIAENVWGDKESISYQHDRKNWIVKTNNHPAIIDQATFDKVQKILKEKPGFKEAKLGRPNGSRYLLHGRLVCGKCGGNCVGKTHRGTRQKQPIYEYHCLSRLRHGNDVCDASAFVQARPDQFVIDKITKDLGDPKFAELVKEKLRLKLKSELSVSRDQKSVKRDIETCERAIRTLLTRIEDDKCDNWELLNGQLAQRREDLERLNDELRQFQNSKQDMDAVEKAIAEIDARFLEAADYLSDGATIDEELNEIRKKIIRQFLYKAIVSKDRSRITFYFHKIPLIDIGSTHHHEDNVTPPYQDNKDRQGTGKSLGLIDNPENYQVEVLNLREDTITEYGETWYTYHAYAELKQISYNLVKSRAERGQLARRSIYGKLYVRDKEEVETIIEDGQVWYTYLAFAKLRGVTYSTVGSEAARGTLEKKLFNGKPFVHEKEKPEDIIVEDGQTWYRYGAFARLQNTSPEVIEHKARKGRLERKYFFGLPYVRDAKLGDTIVEDGRTWRSYRAYAELTGSTYGSVEYRCRRGVLARKYFQGRPYVSDKQADNTGEMEHHPAQNKVTAEISTEVNAPTMA